MVASKEDKEVSYPGEPVSVVEEFLPGDGTYAGDDGYVRSSFAGRVEKDLEERRIRVKPGRRRIPRVGDSVLGVLTNVSGIYGTLKIETVDETPIDRQIDSVLYPSRHLKRGEKQYYVGDYVYGEIVSYANRTFHVSIKGDKYGVVRSLCDKCPSVLDKGRKKGELKCPQCGFTRRSKISNRYGEVV